MWNTEINRKNRLCNTQGVKKNHLGASKKMEVKKEKLFARVGIYLSVC